MNDIRPESTSQAPSSRARVVSIGGLLPVAIAVVATVLMLSWLPQLPNPIAVHWNGAGVDGFGPAIPFVFAPLAITAVFSVFAVAWSWKPLPSGRLTWNQKILLAASLWMAVLLGFAFTASIALQRGLADARTAPDVGPWLALGAGAGLVLAVAAWFLLPAGETVSEPGTEPKFVDVQGDERVSWSRSTRLGGAPLIVVALAILVALGTAAVSVLAVSDAVLISMIVLVVVGLLVLTNFWWRVSADRRGFIAKGLFGWPRKRIPLSEIRSVAVVDVHPTRDFGGWGWRWAGGGRSGIILRAGSGIEVTQSNGKRFIVTVADAATGAGVLVALLHQNAPT